MKTIGKIVVFIALLAPTLKPSAKLDWRSAEGVPFEISSGVELARHAAGKRPAKLSLVCSVRSSLHLLLRTRLPFPEGYRPDRFGRDDDVAIFVGAGIERQLPIVVDVVATGRNRIKKLEDFLFGIDEPDTIITPPLSAVQAAKLEGWFGTVPPTRVSVAGMWETAVFMVGTRAGDAIRTLREGCAATPG